MRQSLAQPTSSSSRFRQNHRLQHLGALCQSMKASSNNCTAHGGSVAFSALVPLRMMLNIVLGVNTRLLLSTPSRRRSSPRAPIRSTPALMILQASSSASFTVPWRLLTRIPCVIEYAEESWVGRHCDAGHVNAEFALTDTLQHGSDG